MRDELLNTVNRLYRENNQRGSTEAIIAADVWGPVKGIVDEIDILNSSIDYREDDVKLGLMSRQDADAEISETKAKIDKAIARGLRYRNKASQAVLLKIPPPETESQQEKFEEEKEEIKKEKKKTKVVEKKAKAIVKTTDKAIEEFTKKIPDIQKETLAEVQEQIKRLDLKGDKVAVTVKNLSILNSIKKKLDKIIINPEYLAEVKEFAKSFNEVFKMQADLWKTAESTFKPRPLLKAIRNQAITDTVQSLTTSGIGPNISDNIVGILRQNITAGGSYADLAEQLRESIITTPESPGLLEKYTKQVTSDAINQFNRQYTQVVSSDLGYEWYRYMNTDITTTRCFCDAMTDKDFFHITEVPKLLKGQGLRCKGEPVKIYPKTELPYGMIPGTNAENFFVRAGGYNCRHSIQPVAARQVPAAIRALIEATPEYKAYAAAKAG